MSVVDKTYREQCWLERDNYWNCLDNSKEENDKCLKLRNLFEQNCPNSWVTHFDQKREYDIFKRQLTLGEVETNKLKSIKQQPSS